MTTAAVPAPGFADPTRDAQRAFRAILDALAHPARPYPVYGPAEPPGALGRGLAAVALTLLDEDCQVWLGGALRSDAETAAWLAFHTGAGTWHRRHRHARRPLGRRRVHRRVGAQCRAVPARR